MTLLESQPKGTAEPVEDPELPEPDTVVVHPPFEPLTFRNFEELDQYRAYLASLRGQEIIITARTTHTIAELTGFLVTQSAKVDFHSVKARITDVDQAYGYVKYEVLSDDGTPAEFFSQTSFIRIEDELETEV